MKRSILRLLALLVLSGLLLVACGPTLLQSLAAPAPEATNSDGVPVMVAHVGVEVGVGSPIPVDIMIAGSWPHLCSQLQSVTQVVEGRTIRIDLETTPEPADCPPDMVGLPFRLAFPLNGIALEPGEYTVEVNGLLSVSVGT